MKKIIVFVIAVILISFGYFILNSNHKLLTQGLKKVTTIKVNIKGEEKIYTIENNENLIKEIYNSIKNTKTKTNRISNSEEGQESEPAFSVIITYNNGKTDYIKSTETSEFIFRVFDKNGSWVGGKNVELVKLVKSGKWENPIFLITYQSSFINFVPYYKI